METIKQKASEPRSRIAIEYSTNFRILMEKIKKDFHSECGKKIMMTVGAFLWTFAPAEVSNELRKKIVLDFCSINEQRLAFGVEARAQIKERMYGNKNSDITATHEYVPNREFYLFDGFYYIFEDSLTKLTIYPFKVEDGKLFTRANLMADLN